MASISRSMARLCISSWGRFDGVRMRSFLTGAVETLKVSVVDDVRGSPTYDSELTMLRAAAIRLDHNHPFDGFTAAYDPDELQFPVWVLLILTAMLFYASVAEGSAVLMLLGLFPGCFAFHNFPLLETGKTRLAANQDSLFIEGLGRIGWHFVKSISLAEVVVRGSAYKEADIALAAPLTTALMEDGRNMTLYRRLMRKPFYLKSGQTIRVPLEIFNRPPEDILAALMRIWVYNRARPQRGDFG